MQPLANVAEQLFELVIQIDPARTSWESLRESALVRCRALSKDIDALLAQMQEASVERTVREALASARANLTELADAFSHSAGATRWRQLYASLARNYDELTKTIAEEPSTGVKLTFRRLSPTNYFRNVWHILGGVAGALLYHFFLDRTGATIVMAIFVVTFTTLEILRRSSASMNDALMRFPFFRRIARAREYYAVNSSTYYAWGMLAAVILFPRQAVEAACFVLAFGDPAASNTGRRWGKLKIHRDKSVVGTVAFAAAAFIPLFVYQLLFYGEQPMSQHVLVALVGAGVGALVEAFTTKLDDNLTVPLAVALAISFVV